MTKWFDIFPGIYRKCALQALRNLARNWLIIPASIAAYLVSVLVTGIAAQLGFLGGILAGLFQVLLLAFYYGWLRSCSERDKLTSRNLLTFDAAFFSDILNVAFILFLALYTVRLLAQGSQLVFLVPLVQLGVFLVFSCLPEVIYVQRASHLEAFSRAARFTREHWVEWYLPLIVLILPWAWRSFEYALLMFAQSDPLLPVLLPVRGITSILPGFAGFQIPGLLISVIVANWYMLFRGLLFTALQSRSNNPYVYRSF